MLSLNACLVLLTYRSSRNKIDDNERFAGGFDSHLVLFSCVHECESVCFTSMEHVLHWDCPLGRFPGVLFGFGDTSFVFLNGQHCKVSNE